MKTPSLANIRSSAFQRGVAAVEFALIAIPFFLLLFGVMEFGRLLYVWNTAQEVTRHAARLAVVTDFNKADSIKRAAVFHAGDTGNLDKIWLPASPEITAEKVVILYLDASGDEVASKPPTPKDNIAACLENTKSCIRYVEVCLSESATCRPGQPIPFQPMIGLFATGGLNSPSLLGISIPLSTVRMPAESLGFDPTS